MKYTLVKRGDPRAPMKDKKVFAVAQSHEVVTLKKLARHITEHGCAYSQGDMMAVTSILAQAVAEQLKMGNQVDLGDLGKFYVTLDSLGADTPEEFNPGIHIRGLRPKWSPSQEFQNLRNDLSFEESIDRRTERQSLRLEREKRSAEETS